MRLNCFTKENQETFPLNTPFNWQDTPLYSIFYSRDRNTKIFDEKPCFGQGAPVLLGAGQIRRKTETSAPSRLQSLGSDKISGQSHRVRHRENRCRDSLTAESKTYVDG